MDTKDPDLQQATQNSEFVEVKDNITELKPVPKDLTADQVLQAAKDHFKDVLIIGWGKDQRLAAFSTMSMTASDINWLIDTFKKQLLNGDFSDD